MKTLKTIAQQLLSGVVLFCKIITAAVLVLAVVGWMVSSRPSNTAIVAPPETGKAKSPIAQRPVSETQERDFTTKIATMCGVDEDDAYTVYQAVNRGDVPALEGLAERGKMLTLEKGVAVHRVLADKSLSRIVIASGRHVNERCWILTSFLR